MTLATYTPEQLDAEYVSFKRSPDWELRAIRQALHWRVLNTSEQEARLAAVKRIQRERQSARRQTA